MDEVDQLSDERILRDLYEIPTVTPVLIANREADLFSGLEPRIRSRLSVGYRIRFQPYADQEVFDIIQKRAEHGLRQDAVNRTQLREIANSASFDARVAIETLRLAARDAEANGLTEIEDAILQDAIEHGATTIRQKSISRLDRHQRIRYEVIETFEQWHLRRSTRSIASVVVKNSTRIPGPIGRSGSTCRRCPITIWCRRVERVKIGLIQL